MKRREKPGDEERGVALTPYRLIQDAVRAVPAVRYALGVAGIVSVIAVIAGFRVDPRIAVWGTMVIMVLMVGLVVFAKLTTTAKKHFLAPALVLMWSFLTLLILTATMLFTSVFFRFPVDLRDWLKPGPVVVPASKESEGRAKALVQLAASQAAEYDCVKAWGSFNQAVEAAPGSTEVRRARRDFAMAWLREEFRDPSMPAEEVGGLVLPVLYEDAQAAAGKEKAEVLAHIGLAMFNTDVTLGDRYREGPLREALALDAGNVSARAVLGAIIAFRDKKYVPEDFAAAIADPAHEGLGRLTRRWALLELREAGLCPTYHIAVAAWKAGEELPEDDRSLIGEAYVRGVERLGALCPDIPIASHEAAFARLIRGDSYLKHVYIAARLRELTGDIESASTQYRAIRKKLRERESAMDPDVEAGLWRCAGPELRRRAPEIVDDELRWARFEAESVEWWWHATPEENVTDVVDSGWSIHTVTRADKSVRVSISSTAPESVGCGEFEGASALAMKREHPLAYLAWNRWGGMPRPSNGEPQLGSSKGGMMQTVHHDLFLAGVRMLEQLRGREGGAQVTDALVQLADAIDRLPAGKNPFLDSQYVGAVEGVWETSARLKLEGPGDSIELPQSKRLGTVMVRIREDRRAFERPLTVVSMDPKGRGAKVGLMKDDLIWGVNSTPVMTEHELRRELLRATGALTVNVVREYRAVDLREAGA